MSHRGPEFLATKTRNNLEPVSIYVVCRLILRKQSDHNEVRFVVRLQTVSNYPQMEDWHAVPD